MSSYVIGDVQGCYDGLQKLLETINYQDDDHLFFAGDVVNRGPQSLATLRFLKSAEHCEMVLGNHDLHLLAIHAGVRKAKASDTVMDILQADDGEELIAWLRSKPLLLNLPKWHSIVVHAGIYPQWSLTQAMQYSQEVQTAFQDDDTLKRLLSDTFDKQPALWDDSLNGDERLHVIINIFTYMRYLNDDGSLEYSYKGKPPHTNARCHPWFSYPLQSQQRIFFGHWAALEAKANHPQVVALDSGYVWGGKLTAYRLDDDMIFQVA